VTARKAGTFALIPVRAASMDLTACDLRVLVAIARHADKDGRANPSLSSIASSTGVSRRHVSRSIASLEKVGLMSHRQQKGPGGAWTHSVYEILFTSGQQIASEPKQRQDEGHTVAVEMLRIWREECGAVLAAPRALDRSRTTACEARFRDSFDQDFERWRALCREVKASSFCYGGGCRGWKADFDWVLKPKSIRNLSEGKDRDGRSAGRRAVNSGAVGFENYDLLPLGPGGT